MLEALDALLAAPFIRFLIVLLAATVVAGAFSNRQEGSHED